MKQPCPIKTVGRRQQQPLSAVECHLRALTLQKQADRLNPFPKPRGFVFKAQTREIYENWKRLQTNPRLW